MTRKELLSKLHSQVEAAVVVCGNCLEHASTGKHSARELLICVQVVSQGLELLTAINREFDAPPYRGPVG